MARLHMDAGGAFGPTLGYTLVAMAQRTVAITGGTGLIGRALCPVLLEKGYRTIVLSRSGRAPAGAEAVRWDGKSIPSGLLPSEGLSAIINLAGAGIADKRWSAAYKQEIRESRVQATQAVVQWLEKNAPQVRLISASAVGYYGTSLLRERVSEDFPSGSDFLAGVARAWESAAWDAPRTPVIFRIGVVLSKNGGAFPQLLRGFRLGVGSYPGPGEQGFSWVHIEDVVRALIWVLEHPEIEGVLNLTAPIPVSMRAFAEEVARRLNIRILIAIPPKVLHWTLGELADMLVGGIYAEPVRLLEERFVFRYRTVKEALAELLG
ncbi:MAG: TIGR01777 family oxidoreductase [Bacteroidia bacterium]|nr:TIGR01777 family oxidoreductase [Bacteroidia bacterium]MDW8236526.1 TIGR01777 family oxidoreductase [Bacteroidia bacterium]